MMNRRFVFVLLFLFTALIESKAQFPFLRKLGYNERLPTQVIYDLFISNEGYLYMGTEIGLIRYNGIDFKRIPITGNLGNSINMIQEDTNGTLWCMNFSNQIFRLQQDTLKPALEINQSIAESTPLRSFAVAGQSVWVVTDGRVFLAKNGQIEDVLLKNEVASGFQFIESYYDGKETVYITDHEFIYAFKNNRLVGKSALIINSHFEIIGYGGDLLIAEKNDFSNVYSVNKKFFSSAFDAAPKNTYLNRFSVCNAKIWMCTNTGLYELDYLQNKINKPILEGVRITDIVQDKEGGYWISSVEKGLFYMPSEHTQMKKLSEYNLSAICKGPNHSFFIGTGKGSVLWVDSNTNVLNEWQTPYFTEIEYITFDSASNRLISSHGYLEFVNNRPSFSDLRLGKRIAPDNRGNFLVCLYNKAILLNQNFSDLPNIQDKRSSKYILYDTKIPIYNFRDNRSRCAIFQPTENRYYIGFSDDLYSYDTLANANIVKFGNESLIASDMIIHDDGTIIVASMQHGLILLKNNQIIGRFTIQNGLSSNTCKVIRRAGNRYFIITDEGLDMIDVNQKTIVNLASLFSLGGLGISDLTFSQNKAFITTNEGLMTLQIPDSESYMLPEVIRLRAFAKKRSDSDIANEMLDGITLNYDRNDIQIEASVLHFQSGGNFKFQYRLMGYDSSWYFQPAQNNTFNYLSLPPGDYRFELRTLFNNFPSDSTHFSFSIASPVWKKSWFVLLMILTGISLLFWIQRYSTKRLKKKQLVNEKLLRSQITALRSQMNPHFMFNVLNSVQGLIFSNKKNEASAYLGKFSALMRNVLDFSDKPSIPIRNELEMLRMYLELEAARFENDFTYEFIENLPADYLDIPIPSMIIQPYIENSVKHGLLHKRGDKKLIIRFSLFDKNGLRVEIDDNGIGRLESGRINLKKGKHKSFATQAIDSRIQLINKTLNNPIQIQILDKMNQDNTESLGTKVIIDIPVIYE